MPSIDAQAHSSDTEVDERQPAGAGVSSRSLVELERRAAEYEAHVEKKVMAGFELCNDLALAAIPEEIMADDWEAGALKRMLDLVNEDREAHKEALVTWEDLATLHDPALFNAVAALSNVTFDPDAYFKAESSIRQAFEYVGTEGITWNLPLAEAPTVDTATLPTDSSVPSSKRSVDDAGVDEGEVVGTEEEAVYLSPITPLRAPLMPPVNREASRFESMQLYVPEPIPAPPPPPPTREQREAQQSQFAKMRAGGVIPRASKKPRLDTPAPLPSFSLQDLEMEVKNAGLPIPAAPPAAPPIQPTPAQEPTKSTLKVYLRVMTFARLSDFRVFLAVYEQHHPSDIIWVRGMRKAIEIRITDEDDPISLVYCGETCFSGLKRAHADALDSTSYSRLHCLTNQFTEEMFADAQGLGFDHTSLPSAFHIFEYDTGLPMVPMQFRHSRRGNALERVLISAASPCINSARGGFSQSVRKHRLCPQGPVELLSRRICPLPAERKRKISRCIHNTHRLFSKLRVENRGTMASKICMEGVVKVATQGSLDNGAPITTMVGSGITLESLKAKNRSLHFFGRYTGQGPRVTMDTRGHAMGVDANPIERNKQKPELLFGAFLDFWSVCDVHKETWLATICMQRQLEAAGHPLILRSKSANLNLLFLRGAFGGDDACLLPGKKLKTNEQVLLRTAFLAGTFEGRPADLKMIVSSEYSNLNWEDLSPSNWIDIVGTISIVPIGDSWAILVPNYDGGVAKYDPVLQGDIISVMEVVELISAKVEEEAVAAVKKLNAVPELGEGRLNLLVKIKESAEKALRDAGVLDELTSQKEGLSRLSKEVRGARADEAWRVKKLAEGHRGESDEASRVRAETFRISRLAFQNTSVKAEGKPKSTERKKQFDKLLIEFNRLRKCGAEGLFISPAAPPRPLDFWNDDAAWRKWWIEQPRGHHMWAAKWAKDRVAGKRPPVPSTTHQLVTTTPETETKGVAKVRTRRLGKEPIFISVLTFLEAMLALVDGQGLASTKKQICVLSCKRCKEVRIVWYNNGRHKCPFDEEAEGLDENGSAAQDHGRQRSFLRWPEELLIHPDVGLLHQNVDWPSFLAENKLKEKDAWTVLHDHRKDSDWKGFIPKTLPDDDYGLIIVREQKEKRDEDFMVSQACAALIRSRVTDSAFDWEAAGLESPKFSSFMIDSMIAALEGTVSMREWRCNLDAPCTYRAVRRYDPSGYDSQCQHNCRITKTHDPCRIVENVEYRCFEQLPVEWQLEIFHAYCNKEQSHHRKNSKTTCRKVHKKHITWRLQ